MGLFVGRIDPFCLKIRPGKDFDQRDLKFMLIGPDNLKNDQTNTHKENTNNYFIRI